MIWKRICCFFFLALWGTGFLAGFFSGGQLYGEKPKSAGQGQVVTYPEGKEPEGKEPEEGAPKREVTEKGTTEEGTTEEGTTEEGEPAKGEWIAASVSARTGGGTATRTDTRYPGERWKKKLFLEYLIGTVITVILLLPAGKPRPLMVFWMLYGGFAGLYAKGMVCYYGRTGLRYCLLGFLPTAVFAGILTGILWQYRRLWMDPLGRGSGNPSSIEKRIRLMTEHLRTRFVRTAALLFAVFFCYLLDYEIVKRLQWKLLLQMLGNRIN